MAAGTGQVTLNLQQMQNQPPIVNINGVDYRYTISRINQNGSQQLVTDIENWKDVAAVAVTVFTGQGPFESAEMIVTEDTVNPTLRSAKVFKKLDPARPDITEQDITANIATKVSTTPALQQAFNDIKQHFATQAPGPAPLNISPPPAAPPLPNYLKNIDTRGGCLDMSIAYTMLKKEGVIDPQPVEIEGLANQLRTEAATEIRDNLDLRKDEKFIEALADTIRSIPGIAAHIQALSQRVLREFADYAKTNDASEIQQLEILFNFYSDHIIAKDVHNEMHNWLDRAFFYVLPLTSRGNQYQYAQLQQDLGNGNVAIQSNYPIDKDLSQGNVIFVFYNGTNHYYACDEDDANFRTFIKEEIKEHQKATFESFKASINLTILLAQVARLSEAETKAQMERDLNALKNRFKLGFDALAGLMYDYDLNAWENSDKSQSKPGGDKYGEEQLYAMVRGQRMSRLGLEELDTLLNNEFSLDKLGEKIAAI